MDVHRNCIDSYALLCSHQTSISFRHLFHFADYFVQSLLKLEEFLLIHCASSSFTNPASQHDLRVSRHPFAFRRVQAYIGRIRPTMREVTFQRITIDSCFVNQFSYTVSLNPLPNPVKMDIQRKNSTKIESLTWHFGNRPNYCVMFIYEQKPW